MLTKVSDLEKVVEHENFEWTQVLDLHNLKVGDIVNCTFMSMEDFELYNIVGIYCRTKEEEDKIKLTLCNLKVSLQEEYNLLIPHKHGRMSDKYSVRKLTIK
jgi:hypothetical protein